MKVVAKPPVASVPGSASNASSPSPHEPEALATGAIPIAPHAAPYVTIGPAMSIELPPTPLAPVIRFRMRTVLAVTTVLAIAAAVAAPFWRKQAPPVQTALITYWVVILLCGALGGWMNWRQAWQLLPDAGDVRYIGWAAKHHRWGTTASSLITFLSLAGFIAVVATQSGVIARGAQSLMLGPLPVSSLAGGLAPGFMLGGAMLYFLRRPLYFCENGACGLTGAPWKYIRHAEWLTERPGVMKLHRLDGDIYADVPAIDREAVEAFVRTKTKFIDAAPSTPELQPTP